MNADELARETIARLKGLVWPSAKARAFMEQNNITLHDNNGLPTMLIDASDYPPDFDLNTALDNPPPHVFMIVCREIEAAADDTKNES